MFEVQSRENRDKFGDKRLVSTKSICKSQIERDQESKGQNKILLS